MGWEAVRPLQKEHNEYFSEKTPKACLTSCTDILEKLLRGFKSKWIQNTIIKFPLILPVGVKRKKQNLRKIHLRAAGGGRGLCSQEWKEGRRDPSKWDDLVS